VLTLLCWGESDPSHFPWLTSPVDSALEQAFELLVQLGAVTADRQQVTPLGRQMQSFPLDPRLARLLIEGARLGIPRAAAWGAAMLAERDPFDSRQNSGRPAVGSSAVSCDVSLRVAALLPGPDRASRLQAAEQQLGPVRHHVLRTIELASRQLIEQLLPGSESEGETEAELNALLPRALLAAYPDRLAKRRDGNAPRGLMVGGRGVKLAESSRVRYAELFLCIDADAAGAEATVRLATRIEPDWLPSERLEQVDTRFLNPTTGAVTARRQTRWLDLPIQETPIATPLDQRTAQLLAKAAAERFDRLLPPKDKRLHSLVRRIRWLHAAAPQCGVPSLDQDQLAQRLVDWCLGLKSLDEVRQLDWHAVIESWLDPAVRQTLRQQAPESLTLPSGRQVLLEYEPGRPPILAARIQEFFGLHETPRLAQGRVPLLLHLLAPNQRCQQVTDDLASFWKNTYPVVRKELRGRYPKHAWPEDPTKQAPGPTSG
jgi:ATP-dependent helicase HrpB